jgi:hypothetical protein
MVLQSVNDPLLVNLYYIWTNGSTRMCNTMVGISIVIITPKTIARNTIPSVPWPVPRADGLVSGAQVNFRLVDESDALSTARRLRSMAMRCEADHRPVPPSHLTIRHGHRQGDLIVPRAVLVVSEPHITYE